MFDMDKRCSSCDDLERENSALRRQIDDLEDELVQERRYAQEGDS